jgi:CHAT domain-containing protein
LRSREDPTSRARLRRAYAEYEDLVLGAAITGPSHERLREARPVEPVTVREALDSETALVEYAVAGEQVYALVVTRLALRSVALPASRSNLAEKVKLFRALLAAPASPADAGTAAGEWQAVAEDLRRVLVDPIEQSGMLAGVRRLGLIPFGSLHDLPFAALARSGAGRPVFLVEEYALFRVPSAGFLVQAARRASESTAPGKAALAFGRNESNEPWLARLEFADVEARSVARITGGEARVGVDASESELARRAPLFRYLHFATHAVSEPHMPLLSRLELQPTRDDDGRLTVREVLDLGLRAELVTLGACGAGQSFSAGQREASEVDRLGLAEAFLHAGAESVLASLLPVHDRSTTEFMTAFYDKLRTLEKAEALAATQRAMLAGEISYVEAGRRRFLSHPRYWAPFVLDGDFR